MIKKALKIKNYFVCGSKGKDTKRRCGRNKKRPWKTFQYALNHIIEIPCILKFHKKEK